MSDLTHLEELLRYVRREVQKQTGVASVVSLVVDADTFKALSRHQHVEFSIERLASIKAGEFHITSEAPE